MAGEQLDLLVDAAYPTARPAGKAARQEPAGGDAERPFIGLEFGCCNTYARVYANPELTAFVGRCPRCARPVHLRIAEDGQPGQFFRVS